MISPEHIRRFEEALDTERPFDSLHQLAVSLRDAGTSQFDLYLLFEHFFVLVQDASPDDSVRQDAILDNMDQIWGGGWAKGHDLYPAEISRSELEHYRPQA